MPLILIFQLSTFREKKKHSESARSNRIKYIVVSHLIIQPKKTQKTTKKEVVFNWVYTAKLFEVPWRKRNDFYSKSIPSFHWLSFFHKMHVTFSKELFPRTFQRPAWSVLWCYALCIELSVSSAISAWHTTFYERLSVSFFQVTFWSPKWRSLNPWKGHESNHQKGDLEEPGVSILFERLEKTSWWFQPNLKILVKLDHFSK